MTVRGSSPAFAITHVKAMIVDGDTAFITAINLTNDGDRTRDLGIVTRDRAIVADAERLFAADWQNAATRGHATPDQREASLVVAPTTARSRLAALIASAHRELLVTVENLGDPQIEDALVAAARRGAKVRAIVPLCDKNPNQLYNLPAAQHLAAAGIDIRMMPAPETPEQPYMHSKTILADGGAAYVGSVNFSVNSTTKARELARDLRERRRGRADPRAVRGRLDARRAPAGRAPGEVHRHRRRRGLTATARSRGSHAVYRHGAMQPRRDASRS